MNYKIKVKRISSDSALVQRAHEQGVYLGISMHNPIFRHRSLLHLLEWIEANYPNYYLLMGDYLNRWNELIFNTTKPAEARQFSLQHGHDLAERLLNTFPDKLSAERILHWKNLLDEPGYWKVREAVDKAYWRIEAFSESLNRSAEKFIEKQLHRGYTHKVTHNQALAFSKQYLREELAMFGYLTEKGIGTQLYPGSQLPILHELFKLSQIGVPESLLQSTFIELRIKKV